MGSSLQEKTFKEVQEAELDRGRNSHCDETITEVSGDPTGIPEAETDL